MSVIVKASQRGNHEKLAWHLMNEADNESVRFLHLRGAVSDTLPGAFAEWDAHSLVTNSKKPFYSLSINPTEEWSDEWYFELLGRMETKLGLAGQPRAVVEHVKDGRPHFHAAYSLTMPEEKKIVRMAFDYDKIQMTVKEFARDKGIQLAEGYYKEKGQHDGKGQLLLHEKVQQDLTGITKEQRQAIITDIWRRSDTPQAFLAGLQDNGFMLCKGRRPFLLVDYYGGVNALPRLIDDKQVRTKDIQQFLEPVVDLENLPDVEEMRKFISQHRKQEEQFKQNNLQRERKEQIQRLHAERRQQLQQELAQLQLTHDKDLVKIKEAHFSQRSSLRAQYLGQKSEVTLKRDQQIRQGLSALMAKATGFQYLKHRFQRYQDSKRHQTYTQQKEELRQQQQEYEQRARHEQALVQQEIQARLRRLDYREKEELRALVKKEIREHRIQKRQWTEQVPNLNFVLSPYKFRKANLPKAKDKHNSELAKDIQRAVRADKAMQDKQSDGSTSDAAHDGSVRQEQSNKRTKTRTLPSRGEKGGGKKR